MGTYATTCSAQLIILILFFMFMSAVKIEKVNAFSLKFYQHDSKGSPFYNSSLSKSEIIRRAVARSVHLSDIITTDNNAKAKVILYRSEYLVHIRIGTPLVDAFALLDTGSDFSWIQCEPCIQCVPQITPIFNPETSSSYDKISCGPNNPCPPKYKSRCEDGFCTYNARYGDGSNSKGILSKETLRLESNASSDHIVKIYNYIFGCGNDNVINTNAGIAAVLGLGTGPWSLVSQLGSPKFSYCLIPFGLQERVSHIHFGSTENVRGQGTVTIPLVDKRPSNHYSATLEAFTIGETRIEFTTSSDTIDEGNIVIDSGTAMTMVPHNIYVKMKHAVMVQANARPVRDPNDQFDLCFKKDESLHVPNIVANFRGGDVSLKQYNAFVSVDQMECFAFRVLDSVPIYGSLAQQNFIVGYDRVRGTISFTPFKCSDF